MTHMLTNRIFVNELSHFAGRPGHSADRGRNARATSPIASRSPLR
jgi:hypothetical protein